MVKVLVIDDQQIFLDGLAHLFQNDDNYEINLLKIETKESLDLEKVSEASVILMDIKMPGVSGIDLTKEIIKQNRFVKIIFMSVYHKKELLFDIIETGAKGYISKNSRKSELIEAIETVMAGKTFFKLPEN